MKNTKIIIAFILAIALFFLLTPFCYLDKECFFIGESILKSGNVSDSLGLKPALYTRCPSSFEFLDTKNNGISCYFSFISNTNCVSSEEEGKKLLFYMINNSHIYLCEEDSIGRLLYSELRRVTSSNGESFINAVEVDNNEMLVNQSTKIILTNMTCCGKIIAARDCCLYIMILIVIALIINIISIISTKKCI